MHTLRVLGTATALTAALALSACGDSGDAPAEDTSDSAGADSGDSGDSADAGSGSFPVTIEHAFGETTIEEKPERVATVAWANHEVPLALGVVPVGMSEAAWGDDDGDGVLPWVEDALTELDAETPVLFDEADGIDFEAVAGTEPDVILAAYSGLTQEDYDTLSEIAPVVAYPEIAWGTSMNDMIEMNATAIGMPEEGQALIDDLDQQIQDTLAEYPDLEGAAPLFSYVDPNDISQVGFYTTHDPRAGFLADIGMSTPQIVEERSAESEAFYETVSAENSDLLEDVDVFITYGDPDGEILDLVQNDPLMGQIPAIESGAVAILEDNTPLAAAANPSPLAIEWGLSDYLGVLNEALTSSR